MLTTTRRGDGGLVLPADRQRRVVVLALTMLLVVATWWPTSSGAVDVPPGLATCGPGDANRADLTTRAGVQLRPCLSGVTLRISIPPASSRCGIFGRTCWDKKWSITGVSRSGLQTVRLQDGTTQQLYRLTFREFAVTQDVTLQTVGGNGYTLTLAPDADAVLGGQGSAGTTVVTDMWVTGESLLRFEFSLLLLPVFTCESDTRVDNGILGTTDWIPLSVRGCGMSLDARYVVTTAETGPIQGQYSVRLPDTDVTVGP
ncbi:hypothetical protein TEK04_11520 [Klenkia sp. LSe6-5]|uniref:Secreted protein n=1 Tax=Klenkia sesuvii TaxID=3103137 RepID=A0ABU8DU42_9ACTN